MSDDESSYWIDDVEVEVLSPLAILRIQAASLSKKTHGLLEAEVVTATTPKTAAHELQLIAPALGGERRTVLTVVHAVNEPYPATVEAAVFEPDAGSPDPNDDRRPTAPTVQEFKDLIKRAIQSKPVRAAARSLLARSEETSAPASA
jgi:hypothetical protein